MKLNRYNNLNLYSYRMCIQDWFYVQLMATKHCNINNIKPPYMFISQEHVYMFIKGALDNFSLSPVFSLKNWDFYTIRSVCICDSMLNLTYWQHQHIDKEIWWIFLSFPIHWSGNGLLEMATTVEFGAIHHYCSLVKNSKACVLQCFR